MTRWSEQQLEHFVAGRKTKAKATRSKYRNVRTERDGHIFDSKREADRWTELQTEEKAGVIRNIERQVRYALVVGHTLICEYVCDFRYEMDGRVIVEDVKGMKTEVYRLKKKLMKACHGIDIHEVA